MRAWVKVLLLTLSLTLFWALFWKDSGFVWANPGTPSKMDLQGHELVIEKLESSLKFLDPKDQNVDHTGLKLQLANLYSEKSRLLLLEEGKQSCVDCLASKATRMKAIRLYQESLPRLKGSEKDQVTLQLAHLLEQTGKQKEALGHYQKLITQKGTSRPALAKAYSKRASHFFREGNLDKAMADYQTLLKLETPEERGTTLHRMAWIHHNQGRIQTAIQLLISVLSEEELLKQPSENGFVYHEGFHSEIARDLALFMAKAPITTESLRPLETHSPPADVISNLLYLGDEAERLGQNKGASLAWEAALAKEGFPEEKKIPVLLSIARHHRDQHRFAQAHAFYEKALQSAQKNNPALLSTAPFKMFLTQWEKHLEKLTKKQHRLGSQKGLIQAYQHYHRFQDEDYETHLWLGQLAQKAKDREIARKAYRRAADLIALQRDQKTAASDTPAIQWGSLLESTLLAEIDLSEQLQQPKPQPQILMEAYDHYLRLNPQGPTRHQVRYQRAKLFYDQGQVSTAYPLFDQIVNDPAFNRKDLQLKSAHLALDSLVLLKQIETLETKSLEYSQKIPKEQASFHLISRRAGLQIVKSLAGPEASRTQAEKALQKLNTVTLANSSESERKTILRMKIDLAVQAHQWETAQSHLRQYLQRRDLAKAERTWALTQRLAMAELLLDFKLAYETALSLQYGRSQNPDHLLKGALLAEILKMNSTPWLEKVIQSPRAQNDQKQLARAQIVRLSKNPWKALRAHAPKLASQPQLLGDLALECFASQPLVSEAEWALGLRGVRFTWSGQTLNRNRKLKELEQEYRASRRQKLNAKTDVLLTSSLQNRIRSLAQLKSFMRLAQKDKDWTLQVVSAHYLKNENERLAQDIEALPIPRRLTRAQQVAYQNELSVQTAPFRRTVSELDQFLLNAWKREDSLKTLLTQAENQTRIQPLLIQELRILIPLAPRSLSQSLQSQIQEYQTKPSPQKVAALQTQMRREPFNSKLSQELVGLEKKRGNQSMVAFLQARNQSVQNQLKGGAL